MSIMHKFICTGCGVEAGSSSASHGTLCFYCEEDAKFPGRPLCSTCGVHRVTCSSKGLDAGETECRGCAQMTFEANMQNEYQPVFDIVKDFTGLQGVVENTGGNVMVGHLYLPVPEDESWCGICSQHIVNGPTGWVHEETEQVTCADGAGSWLDEGTPVVATPQTPYIAVTHDSAEVWFMTLMRHFEDEESYQGIDTEDLPSGQRLDEPLYGPENATPEDVAARILLLLDNPEYGRTEAYGPRSTTWTDFTVDVHLTEQALAALPPAESHTGRMEESIYRVQTAMVRDAFGGEHPAGWSVSSMGPREVLGDGWYRMQLSTSIRADWTPPTVQDVIAFLHEKSPYLNVIRKV